jgi:hypothetical protein
LRELMSIYQRFLMLKSPIFRILWTMKNLGNDQK